jgi:hypothetical protein
MDGFGAALRDELMDATRRPPPPDRRRAALLAAGAVAALVVALVVVAFAPFDRGSQPASAEVDVSHQGGQVRVRLLDRRTTPSEIERATAAAGLDVQVALVPVGPSKVGRFVSAINEGGPEVEEQEVRGDSFLAFSVPEGNPGRLTLELGRAARDGERYGHGSDAFAPGEPLACLDLIGEPLTALRPHVRGLRVRVSAPLLGRPFVPFDEAVATGLGGEPISAVAAEAADALAVTVGAPPPPGAEPERC